MQSNEDYDEDGGGLQQFPNDVPHSCSIQTRADMLACRDTDVRVL